MKVRQKTSGIQKQIEKMERKERNIAILQQRKNASRNERTKERKKDL